MHRYGHLAPTLDLPWIDMRVEIDPADRPHESAILDAWIDLAHGGRNIAARYGDTACMYALAAAIDIHRKAADRRLLLREPGVHVNLHLATVDRIELCVPMSVLEAAHAWHMQATQGDRHA